MCYIWQVVTLPLLIDLQGGTKKYNRGGGRKEGDLATAFDRPSFLTQRYVLRRCGLVAVLLLQKFYSYVAVCHMQCSLTFAFFYGTQIWSLTLILQMWRIG